MINVDLSRALHPRLLDHLAPFMPGLFFEVSILLARPEYFSSIAGRARVGYFTSIWLALILAYIIGTGAVLFVRLIQIWTYSVYRFFTFVARHLGYAIADPIGWILQSQMRLPVRFRMWLGQIYPKLSSGGKFSSGASTDMKRAWQQAASALLQQGYGISPHAADDWTPWYFVLGEPDLAVFRGPLTLLAAQATGWAGLVASRLAPTLRCPIYLGFSGFLVAYGLLANWSYAKNANSETTVCLARIRAVLNELRKARRNDGRDDAEHSADKGAEVGN